MTLYNLVKKYADLGWVLIPANGFTKKPIVNSWKKYQSIRPTDYELRDWFLKQQPTGVALICGKLSGICVVDLDSYKENFKDVPINTPIKVRTGGGGLHGYFKYSDNISKNSVNEELAIDVKTEGGYVLLPPTLHKSGKKYEWQLEGKLDELIKNLPELPEDIYKQVKKNPGGESFKITEHVKVKKGSRNDSLYRTACSLLSKYDTETAFQLVSDINATYVPPLSDSEVQQLFGSAKTFIDSQKIEEITPSSETKIQWPSALAPEAFHGPLGGLVKIIAPHTEVDEVALLVNFLAAFGNVIGDKAFFSVEADKHPARIFAVLVGPSAFGRKGTSIGYLKKVFGEIDPNWSANLQTGLSSGEGLIWSVRDEIKKSKKTKDGDFVEEIIDEGIKDKRLLVIEGEFSQTLRVMAREGNTLSAILRLAWDSGNIQTLTKNSPAKATGAHITILAHVTPGELLRYLSETETSNGFANRFLWLCVKRSKFLPRGGNLQDAYIKPFIEELIKAVKYSTYTEEITRSEETWALWEKVYPVLTAEKPGLFGVLTSRGDAIVTRLSCIYALADQVDVIQPSHLMAALAVWDYCESSVKYIFQNKTGDLIANKIYKALSEKGKMTRTEIRDLFDRHQSTERISIALDLLEENGMASKKTTLTGGRSIETWITVTRSESK